MTIWVLNIKRVIANIKRMIDKVQIGNLLE